MNDTICIWFNFQRSPSIIVFALKIDQNIFAMFHPWAPVSDEIVCFIVLKSKELEFFFKKLVALISFDHEAFINVETFIEQALPEEVVMLSIVVINFTISICFDNPCVAFIIFYARIY